MEDCSRFSSSVLPSEVWTFMLYRGMDQIMTVLLFIFSLVYVYVFVWGSSCKSDTSVGYKWKPIIFFQLYRRCLQKDRIATTSEIFRFLRCTGNLTCQYILKTQLPNLPVDAYCKLMSQNLSDQGLSCIAKCQYLVSLNLTW